MLKHVIAFSLQRAGLVIAAAMLLVGFTIWHVDKMPVDVFPELNAPTVVIMTESGGLAADEMERYVTIPIESAVNGVSGVRRVRSASNLSLSIVWVEFNWGEDIYRARQLVAERLQTVRENLPANAHAEIAPVSSVTGEIMLISLTSKDGQASPLEMRRFAEFDLRNQLLSVAGVTQVVAIGGELPEYQVNIIPDKLRLYGLTVQDVVQAAEKANSIAGAGYLADVSGQELALRQTGRIRDVEDIRQTIVRFDKGAAVTVGDVADVKVAAAPMRGTGSQAGEPAVVISIQKAPGSNTLDLTKAIDVALDHVEKTLPAGMVLNRHVVRQADFIGVSIDNVIGVSRDAAIFVAVVLILFLMNARTTIITLTAMPLSVAVALLALSYMGMTINVMTLGGLAVAIGELVDDAIIDVENVFRRLKENQLLPPEAQKSRMRVVFDASNEIRSSVVFATVIIIVVFIPLLFLQGLEGRFFQPLGIAYIVSILASLFVALTVTPAMCYLMLRGKMLEGGAAHAEGWLVRTLKRVYEPLLKGAIRWRIPLLSLALVGTVLALMLERTYGNDFLPSFNEGAYTVFLTAPPGTSLMESDRLARGVERQIARLEGVRSVVRRTGRAERDEHAEPVSSSEIDVALLPGADREKLHGEMQQIIKSMPGIVTQIGQPIEHRLSHIISGETAALAINVYGNDITSLRAAAKEISDALNKVPGAIEGRVNEALLETVPIEYRAKDLARYGLTPADAAAQVETAFAGTKVAEVNEGTERLDVVVRLEAESRKDLDKLREFVLRGANGTFVRLREVADIGRDMGPNIITRENARRKIVVTCNVAEGHNLGDLVAAAKETLDPIAIQRKVELHYGGQFEAQQSASKTILITGALALVAVLLLLQMALGSFRAGLLVMTNLPLALIGGIVAVFIAESPNVFKNALGLFGIGEYQAPVISVASLVGFITLFGIAVRNGILLVNYYQDIIRLERLPVYEAVIKGSMERLIPITMTALTAILGLIPLVMAAGRPGSELLAPLAVVVLGGLATSTVLNLFVVPAGYVLIFGRQSIDDFAVSQKKENLNEEVPGHSGRSSAVDRL